MVPPPYTAVGTAGSTGRVAEWLTTLDLMRQEKRLSAPSDKISNPPSITSWDEAQTVVTSVSAHQPALESETVGSTLGDDSEDDLDIDLAKAALDTGATAFDAREWGDADALLQDALQVLQQLSTRQRAFCDIFALQYKLAVCAYNTQEPTDAEQALMSLIQQPVSSNEHRQYLYDAAHLLSLLYIRTSQIDRARSECERALQGRRRLLGKHSQASLESTALMAHIYVLLDNRARAKACLAMIPEARRDDVQRVVEASLSAKLRHPDSLPVLTRSFSDDPPRIAQPTQTRYTESTHSLPMDNRCYGPVSSTISHPQAVSPRQSHHYSPSVRSARKPVGSPTVTSLSSAGEKSGSSSTEKTGSSSSVHPRARKDYSADLEVHHASVVGAGEPPEANVTSKDKGLSRGEILRNLRCLPVDRIEEAVCSGDLSALVSLLKKKNTGFLRSMQKALHSKRVTALHFAALFGEIEMARRLLSSNYDINEVPELSTTRQSPLKFAMGARQVEMVEFLIANGAKPMEPDTWATLAGHLMDRSWLKNTMSSAEKDDLFQAPSRMISILKAWLKNGRWNVNAPYESSGRTLLHQAVAFESGSYKWDSNLRGTMTRFLCEQGADPTISDTKGNTSHNMATAVNDQELLLILDQRVKRRGLDEWSAELKELPARPCSPVELFDTSTTTIPAKGAGQDYNFGIRRLA